MKAFHLIFCMTVLATTALVNAVDVHPVLYYLNNQASPNSFSSIGETLSSESFLDNIKGSLLSGPNVDLIVVKNLKDEDIRFLFKKTSELKSEHVYEPSVESSYETLIDYLKKSNIEINYYQVSDAREALDLFLQKAQHPTKSVFVVGKNDDKTASRKKRQTNTTTKEQNEREISVEPGNNTVLTGANCAVYFTTIVLEDSTTAGKTTSQELNINPNTTTISCDDVNGTAILTVGFLNNTGFGGDIVDKLVMKFTNDLSYWRLSNSTLSTRTKNYGIVFMGTPYEMETPSKFSFVCTRTIYQLQDLNIPTLPFIKVKVYMNNLQVQPYNVAINGTETTFGRVNYCQGFFSHGIWMAITTTLLLLVILSFGISFLFSIETMDRFDDPKGKPLNIAIEK
jgi:V-type H+-transporting ATPase S1 subunit